MRGHFENSTTTTFEKHATPEPSSDLVMVQLNISDLKTDNLPINPFSTSFCFAKNIIEGFT